MTDYSDEPARDCPACNALPDPSGYHKACAVCGGDGTVTLEQYERYLMEQADQGDNRL